MNYSIVLHSSLNLDTVFPVFNKVHHQFYQNNFQIGSTIH